MPRQRREGWIDWRNSAAKQVIMYDLEEGELPLSEEDFSAEDCWQYIYQEMPEFEHVSFDQFKALLKDHRKQVKKRRTASTGQERALAHDKEI